jgi:hypothetical protein
MVVMKGVDQRNGPEVPEKPQDLGVRELTE